MRGRGFLIATSAVAVASALWAGSTWAANAITKSTTGIAHVSASPLAEASKGKKKRKRAKPAVTRTSAASLPPSSSQTAAASCPKGTHMTGGGHQVTPSFDPVTTTGTRSLTVTSHSVGANGWTATAGAYATPPNPGTLTSAVRCERNALGRLAVTVFGTATLNPSTGGQQNLICPPGTHVISGGYEGTGLASFTFALASQRIIVLESRRTGPSQWTISSYNNSASPQPATITVYATCELNGKGQAVREASSFAALNNDARTSAQATCGKRTHVVSGGFLVSPATFPGSVPMVSVDDSMPVGKRAWRVGAWDYPIGPPPGSSLLAVAYCKKG